MMPYSQITLSWEGMSTLELRNLKSLSLQYSLRCLLIPTDDKVAFTA